MSKFSGRYDLYDSLISIGEIKDFSKIHIFLGDNPIELRIDSQTDLIPYYAYEPMLIVRNNEEWVIKIPNDRPRFNECYRDELCYRNELYKEMVNSGHYLDIIAYRWCYGWDRKFKGFEEKEK
jgi:hypothetical protein